MSQDAIEEILQASALATQVDSKWVKAIICQESQWNQYAVRFEPGYRWLYYPQIFSKHYLISLDTETTTQKMSWGLGQIMGALAREQGHKGLMAELLKPEVNIKHICIRLKKLKTISPLAEDVFAMYNGGAAAKQKNQTGKYRNQEYVDSVLSYLQKL